MRPPSAIALALAILGCVPGVASAARFAVYGDTRDNPADHGKVVLGLMAAKPELALFTGDVAMHGSEEEWARFSQIESPLARAGIRVYPVRGNHDTGPLFATKFPVPPGTSGTSEYYSFDALGVHFVGMDTEGDAAAGSPQYEFVKHDLEAHAGRAPIVVFLHRALYSSGYHGGDAKLQETYAPLFEAAKVLAVFQGHDHDYERSNPIDGVTYLVEGGGGAAQRPFEGPAPAWSAVRIVTFGYVTVDVFPTALDVRAYDENSTIIDRATLPFTSGAIDAGAKPAPRPAAAAPDASPPPEAAGDSSTGLEIAGGVVLLGAIGAAIAWRSRRAGKE